MPKVIDKMLTRHFVAFMDIYEPGKTRSIVGNAYHMVVCGIKSGVIEGLTIEEVDDDPDITRMTNGDYAQLATEVTDLVNKTLELMQDPDPN